MIALCWLCDDMFAIERCLSYVYVQASNRESAE